MTNELNQPAGTIALETPTGETIGLYGLATDNDGNFLYEEFNGDRRDIPSNYRIKAITTQQHPTTEWHNLTEQIQAGANIDWEKLDGVPAKCVHESGAVYQHKLVRNKEHHLAPVTMLEDNYPTGWGVPFVYAWHGDTGWTLYVDRPVPLKTKTADQLPTGTYFKGKAEWTTGDTNGLYVIGESAQGKFILNGGDYLPCAGDPHQWIVTKELGTFQPNN